MRPFCHKLMVIDDLARPHSCDLLLDQNLFEKDDDRYAGHIPPSSLRLLGPRYALLREEFVRARESLRERDGHIRRLFVFFGGSDPTNETEKALHAVNLLRPMSMEVDVVLGEANPHRKELQQACASLPGTRCHVQTPHMAELMAAADLSLGAGGSATWERCFLGLPSITVVTADNQEETTSAVARTGAIRYAGRSGEADVSELARLLDALMRAPARVKEMGQRSLGIMGGDDFKGAAGVAAALQEVGLAEEVSKWC